jgi:predicted RNA-binding protein with PIN domain
VVEVTHARKPGRDAADHEIVRRLRAHAAPGTVKVATSDRALAEQVWASGAAVVGADEFRRRIDG